MPPPTLGPVGSGIGTYYIKNVYLRNTMTMPMTTPAMTTMTAKANPTTPPVPRAPGDGAT